MRAIPALLADERTAGFLRVLGDLLAGAGDVAPELCSCLEEPLYSAAEASGCPVLLLGAVVSVQAEGDPEFWTADRLTRAGRAVRAYTERRGLGPGLLMFFKDGGAKPEQARQLAGRVAGAYFLLTARGVDATALAALAEGV